MCVVMQLGLLAQCIAAPKKLGECSIVAELKGGEIVRRVGVMLVFTTITGADELFCGTVVPSRPASSHTSLNVTPCSRQ